LLKAAELALEAAIASNEVWAARAAVGAGIPEATPADVEWADAVIVGTPTRFGNISSRLEQFIDLLGGLWAQGKPAPQPSQAASPPDAHPGPAAPSAPMPTGQGGEPARAANRPGRRTGQGGGAARADRPPHDAGRVRQGRGGGSVGEAGAVGYAHGGGCPMPGGSWAGLSPRPVG